MRLWLVAAAGMILMLVAACRSSAAAFTPPPTPPPIFQRVARGSISAAGALPEDGGDGGDSELDMDMLAQRIAKLSATEADKASAFEEGLRRRARDVAAADALEDGMTTASLPVVAFDALLPRQRLSGSSEDPTFSRLLRELGLGGLFVMVSLDHKQRKLRRSGVVARIEIVDVDRGGLIDPTAVTFAVVGRRRCRVVGPAEGMVARVGRWRRGYDPDGEGPMLGWGMERFVDAPTGGAGVEAIVAGSDGDGGAKETLKHTEWTPSVVDCALDDDDDGEETSNHDLIARAEGLLPLLDRWINLASDSHTYDNIDVVASTRRRKGHPGLVVDPSRLLRTVLSDLGDRPSPTRPTDLAFWGAALINPLPPLGVAPEIRGRMLEAVGARQRLEILEWGVKRSIGNLEGTSPL